MGLSKIIQEIKDTFQPGKPFDSSVFDHPVAQKTEWKPKASGGTSFKTRSLKKVSTSKLVYKGATSMLFSGGIFVIVPLIISLVIIGNARDMNFGGFQYAFLLFPLIFMMIGFFTAYNGYRPIVIDKKLGYLYKSYKKPQVEFNITPGKKWVSLDNVIALQILSERISSNKSSYTSYEINFVFKDATRYNVVDHGKLSSIEDDAKVISEFLGVPIWNKLTSETYVPKGIKSTSNKAYDSKGQYDDSDKQYNSSSRYDAPSENDRYSSSSQDNDDLDEPYNSLKKRKL